MASGPIFVVGAQRSGTTLVRLLLDAHPSIAIGPETAFLRHVAEAAAAVAGEGRARDDGYALGTDEVEAEVAAAWARLLGRHATSRGALRWGDKTPLHRYHGARIARLFPDAQVVAVVRHPAAVAASRGRWGYEQRETVRDWGSTVRHHLDDAARFGPHRFRLLRYEDLLADPHAVMSELLAFLREPWHDAVLDPSARGQQGVVTDGGTELGAPLDPARALAWTADADPEDLLVLDEEAGDELALLGYRADAADPVGPLPDSPFTARPTPPDPGGALRRAVRQHGVLGAVRRAGAQLRERGAAGALERWRRL